MPSSCAFAAQAADLRGRPEQQRAVVQSPLVRAPSLFAALFVHRHWPAAAGAAGSPLLSFSQLGRRHVRRRARAALSCSART